MPTGQTCGTAPILCAHLLRKVDHELTSLLRSLKPEDWALQTVAPAWKVREVVAHLLDTALRKLSFVRDGHSVDRFNTKSRQDVIALVNRLNQEGVAVYRRLSPSVLIDLLQVACGQYASFHESLDPFAPAAFAVSWAGEDSSLNWFDTARELTERWHHQEQIRHATNRPGIMTRELYHPVLDCFLRALPHHYRDVDAPVGTTLLLEISGDCGGKWLMLRRPGKWQFGNETGAAVACHITIPQEFAWRLFTKGIDRTVARAHVDIEGDAALGEKTLALTSIVG